MILELDTIERVELAVLPTPVQVLFVHTGGWPGLFAYRPEIAAHLGLD